MERMPPPVSRRAVKRIAPETLVSPDDFAVCYAIVKQYAVELEALHDKEDAERYAVIAKNTADALMSGDPARLHSAVKRVKNRKNVPRWSRCRVWREASRPCRAAAF